MLKCKSNNILYGLTFLFCAYRKLLKEDQLEAGTKAAQQEEMERRKRLEQQRKDFPTPAPAVPDSQLGDCCSINEPMLLNVSMSSHTVFLFGICCSTLLFYPKFPHSLTIFPTVDTASILGEVSHLVPALLSKQDVICLDSSGDEDEKVEPKLPPLAIRDGKIDDSSLQLYCSYFQVIQ